MSDKKKLVYNPFKKAYWKKDNLIPKRSVIKQQNDNKQTNHTKDKKVLKETKSTCKACGNVWFYGKEDVTQNKLDKLENFGSEMSDAGASMMCCTGCVPALFIPSKEKKVVRDLNKCDKCGSSAVQTEEVIHELN